MKSVFILADQRRNTSLSLAENLRISAFNSAIICEKQKVV